MSHGGHMAGVWRLLLAAACVQLACLLTSCTSDPAQATQHESSITGGATCSDHHEGCACSLHTPPVSCNPAQTATLSTGATALCYEGTRYCRSGLWGSCENVHGFVPSARPATAALIDQTAADLPCSQCDPNCFRLIDTLDPADGPLKPLFSAGLDYDSSGSGLTLSPLMPPPGGMLPGTGLTLMARAGVPASTQYAGQYRPDDADVYLLIDQSSSMAQETLWLYDLWDTQGPGPLLNPALPCVGGNQTLLNQGISGALACMFTNPQVGAGMFRDIPFDPYATDSTLPAAQQAGNAKLEIAFRNQQQLTSTAASIKTAIASFGGVESSGNPDFAGSQIVALDALATGQGFAMGLDRVSVPPSAACPAGHYGYPCFRSAASGMVVLVTDAPMHNGPKPSVYPYNYDLTTLTTMSGTAPSDIVVPNTNDTVAQAYALSSNTQSILATFVGSDTGFTADLPDSIAGCSADDAAPDAFFRFDVTSTTGPVPISLSTDGSAFATTLSVFDGPPLVDTTLPGSNNQNDLFPNASDVGDVTGKSLVASGDTQSMVDDYQGSLFGNACGTNTLAPDAAFAFDVNGASGPVQLALSLDMGAAHPVLALYDKSAGPLPRWPLYTTTLRAAGNDNAHASPYDLPASGAGSDYFTVTGDTSSLAADYDPSVLGGSLCNPDANAKDAAFHLHVNGTRTLRFDTEGSSFDTVLSLHSRPPLASTGNWVTHPASATHDNTNETTGSAYDVGDMIGRQEIYQGDTTGMSADLQDSASCGLDASCGDAVYTVTLSKPTTLRFGVTGSGYIPGVQITRADPANTVAAAVHSLATGAAHTCTLSGGAAYCWGSDSNGQLGNGGASGGADSAAAVAVSGISQARDLAAGARHSCAVLNDGSVSCWGQGGSGQLGDNSQTDALAPVSTQLGALGTSIQIAAGDAHSCALLANGSIACWGDNARGQLGDGTTTQRLTPVLVSGGTAFVLVAANGNHTCGIRASDHAVLCWGEGRYGQLGDGSTGIHTALAPSLVPGFSHATSLSLGQNHSCAVLSSGRVMCWGRGANGQLGQGTTSDKATPVAVKNYDGSGMLDNAVGDAGGGRAHTCVRTLEGYVFCWGDNSKRQVGDGTSNGSSTRPTGVASLIDASEVVSYYDHVCALRTTGELVCWGDGAHYQLGNGATGVKNVPVSAEPGGGANKVAFGNGAVDLPFASACQSLAQAPEAGCTYGASPSTGESYSFCSTQSRTWHSAGLACKAAGMQLLDVNTVGENAYVASYLSGPSWIGVKRASSSDWLDLQSNVDFQNPSNDLVWHTDTASAQNCPFIGPCSTTPTKGHFINDLPSDPAAADLVDSNPWSSASTWVSNTEPKPTDVTWGNNCVTLDPQGKWSTDACSAVPKPSCGFLGHGCLLGALRSTLANLAGGVLGWLSAGSISLTDLVHLGSGGLFSSPHFSGGVERPYVCEQENTSRDVTLDAGTYYVVVKGIADGQNGNTCTGPYNLSIVDVGAPSGGFLGCDDNGVADTTSAVIQSTLGSGDYYVVVKGKHANDAGAYNLTVRDVTAVQTSELTCGAGGGTGAPAQVTMTAQPGHQYYALVKGDTPIDKGPYTLAIRDLSRVSGARLGCDAQSGPGGGSALTLPLDTGTYYAVLKGRGPTEAGNYRLTVGGATATSSSFVPPTYDQTIAALGANNLRVATVLSCKGAPCADAQGQATQLAKDTNGNVQLAATAGDVPAAVANAVYDLASLDTVTGQLQFSPSPNPGFVTLGAQTVPTSVACIDAGDGVTFNHCGPGSRPTYGMTLLNPLFTPVLPGPGPLGSYQFTLHLEGKRQGSILYQEDVPLYVIPSGGAAPGTYDMGSYSQDLEGRACEHGNFAASWDDLMFDADVLPETQIDFYACSAYASADLALCAGTGGTSSGYLRVVTVTAGQGVGTTCTVATQGVDCPSGYCSPYTNVCQFLEGASCSSDADCPGSAPGRCHAGPSAATLGTTCQLSSPDANPAVALGAANLEPFVRMRADLTSLGDHSRTPALFYWEARYYCRSVL